MATAEALLLALGCENVAKLVAFLARIGGCAEGEVDAALLARFPTYEQAATSGEAGFEDCARAITEWRRDSNAGDVLALHALLAMPADFATQPERFVAAAAAATREAHSLPEACRGFALACALGVRLTLPAVMSAAFERALVARLGEGGASAIAELRRFALSGAANPLGRILLGTSVGGGASEASTSSSSLPAASATLLRFAELARSVRHGRASAGAGTASSSAAVAAAPRPVAARPLALPLPDNLFLPPFFGGGVDDDSAAQPHKRDVFLSHYQMTGGDLALALSTALLAADVTTWYDMNMTPYGLNNEAMREGARCCSLFGFILTPGALTRAAVRMELAEAIAMKKRVILFVPDGMVDADIAKEVEAGVLALSAAPAVDKWLDEGALRAFVAAAAADLRYTIHVGERLQSVTVEAVVAALDGGGEAPDGGASAGAPARRRRRALALRLGTHVVTPSAPPVILVGTRGNAFIEYLRRALLLACPTVNVSILGDAGPPPSPAPFVVAFLEPALFADAEAVCLFENQPLDRLQLFFRKADDGTFGRIVAATPDSFAARSPYKAIEARPIERDIKIRWAELCDILAKVGAERRSEPLPVPPLPPAFDANICAETLASLQGARESRAIVVGGRGGLGKTSAASAFAGDARTQDAFDYILWRTIGRSANRGDLRNALNGVLRALEGVVSDEAVAADLEKLAALARAALEYPGRRVLLVLDDLSDAEYGEHFRLLSSVVPQAPLTSIVLATTRDVDAATRCLPASANPLVCTMAPVAVDAAVRLLSRAAPDLSDAAASLLGALAEEVGRSPYALQLVARILRQTSIDEHESAAAAVNSVRERIAAAPLKPLLVRKGAPPGSAPVYRTIEVAVSETFAPKEREVFSTFGLFAEDADIPIGLFCAAWSRSVEDRDELLQRLTNAALIKRSGACVQLHDFAWDFACAERTPASMAAKQRAFLDRAKAQLCGGAAWAAIHRVADAAVRAYLFRSLRYHLCAAGRADEYTEILFSLDWLTVAMHNKGVQDVIRDVIEHNSFAFADDDAAKKKELRHLFQTLQFSAPGLFEGPAMHERLVAQLVGRLRGIGAVVAEGTRMGRLLAEAEAVAERAMELASSADNRLENQRIKSWLLPVARIATLRGPGGALQATLLGHMDAVQSACFLPNGLIASASEDKSVRIWSVSSGECLKTLHGHEGAVLSVASLGPDSGLIASASLDETVRIWSVRSGECLQTLSGHEGGVRSVISLGPDSGLIASASYDVKVRIWSVSSGKCLKTLDCFETLNGHKDTISDITSLGPDSGLIASASYDETVRIWSLGSGECLKTLKGHEEGVICVTLLGPDSGLIASASYDKTVRIWSVASGECLKTLRGHEDAVLSVTSLGPDCGLIASASSDKTVRIWSISSGECLKTLKGHEQGVICVTSLGPDGDLIASASRDKSVRIWSVASGECLTKFNCHEGDVDCVIFAGPDSSLIASASDDRSVRIWSLYSGECVEIISRFSERAIVMGICFAAPWGIPKLSPTRLLSVHSSQAAFLDADIIRLCPVQHRDTSKGQPLETVGAFTTAHQFHVCALLPCLNSCI